MTAVNPPATAWVTKVSWFLRITSCTEMALAPGSDAAGKGGSSLLGVVSTGSHARTVVNEEFLVNRRSLFDKACRGVVMLSSRPRVSAD